MTASLELVDVVTDRGVNGGVRIEFELLDSSDMVIAESRVGSMRCGVRVGDDWLPTIPDLEASNN